MTKEELIDYKWSSDLDLKKKNKESIGFSKGSWI